MILTYSQFRELENSDNNTSELVESVIESLKEHGSLSYDDMIILFEQVADYHGYEITNMDEYVDSLTSILEDYLIENIDENDEYYYSIDDTAVNEFFGTFKKKEPSTWHGNLRGLGGDLAKAHGKAQAASQKAGMKKQKNLMKHDYKMAKLSSKSAPGGFDSYSKLSGTANNRY